MRITMDMKAYILNFVEKLYCGMLFSTQTDAAVFRTNSEDYRADYMYSLSPGAHLGTC